MRRALGRLALGVTVGFALTVAAPVGAVENPQLPTSWLWSWMSQRPAWADPDPDPDVPQDERGPGARRGTASAEDTTVDGGAGRAPNPAPGALPAYQPHTPATSPEVTGATDQGFDPKTSKRSAAKSGLRTNVYTNADGSLTERRYTRPVNFRDKNGSWQPIDSTLRKLADGRLHASANSLDASVAADVAVETMAAVENVEALATLELPTGESVGYTLAGAAPVTATTKDSTATYASILPDTDLELQTFDAGIKEMLILKSPQAASSWTFPLQLDGLTPRFAANGQIELLNEAGKAVAWFPKGSMEDSKVDPHSGAPAQSGGVTYELIERDGGWDLRVEADRAWLDDPARQYPIKVDPTTTTSTTGDVYVDNDGSTTNQNGDNLPIGTYDDGKTKTRSFIHLDDFGDTNANRHITKAVLKLFLTWQYSCTEDRVFDVRAATEKWTVADLTDGGWPGPSYSASIGSTTVAAPGAACTNTDAVRSQGKWITVDLAAATFDNWARGTATNFGLALTASESDSNGFKRFTSANYDSGKYEPSVELTYVANVAPQVDVRYPANNAVVPTLTPELLVKGHDPDKWPATGMSYVFTVLSADGKTTIATSPAVASAWKVPAGTLAWNTTYLYTVKAYDRKLYGTAAPQFAFTTNVPQPVLTGNLAQNGGKGFDSSTGNYTTSATDASVSSVGPSLAIVRNYNSLDNRRDTAFGTGWSSILDTRATELGDAVRVTYPTGEEVAFGRTATGSFVPPSGRFSTFVEIKSGSAVTGYTLTDKDATAYTFGRSVGSGTYRLTAITDANGRALTVGYDANGNPATMTSASGRKLTMSWTTPAGSSAPHVAAVSTDPATAGDSTTAAVWTYAYGADDRLSTVCQPDESTRCWQYGYDTSSQFRNTTLNFDPESYWPFADTSGIAAKSDVLVNAGMDTARYNNVTLGAGAHLAGGTASAGTFNGTNGYVEMPTGMIADGQYQSISMWFRTATAGGVLFSYNGAPLSTATTSLNYTPSLYIDKDGKLRGELWIGAVAPMQSGTVVTDDKWHHVVLAGAGNTQALYLDGKLKGTLAGTIAAAGDDSTETANIGAGFVGGQWPDHANSGLVPAKQVFFKGSISDVAFYNQTVTQAQAEALTAAGTTAQPVLNKITRPGGGVTATISYDQTTGKVSQVVDENGGTWKLGLPKVAGSSQVYAANVLGAKPQDYWRFGDVDATDAVNEVAGGTATYNLVGLNTTKSKFDDAMSAQFNGTSSYVELPPEDVPTTGPTSIEMWFKMPLKSTKGGVLLGYQHGLPDEAASGDWTPAMYVGMDGKLRAGLWTGSTNGQATTSFTVNDGLWHHAVLAAGTTAQVLYLDGKPVAAVSGAISAINAQHAYVGTGHWAGAWPSHGSTESGWFPGAISDVAFYTSTLSVAQVEEHFLSTQQTAPVAYTVVAGVATPIAMPVQQVTVTTPDGKTQVSSFDLVNGNRMVAQTDEGGNTTQYGYDVGGYASMVYDPNGALTQTLQDVRGNTVQTITCQDQSAKKCSSVYNAYFPDATSTTLTPNPKNDLLLKTWDGRTKPTANNDPNTDNRYLTSNTYDDKGNLTAVTDPLGRVTRSTFTDASTAAADGGTPPTGLPAKVTTPGGTTQTVTYYRSGDVAQLTEPNGKITRLAYDGLGQVLTETEVTSAFPTGVVTTHTYDKLGREVDETDPPSTNRVTGAVHTERTTTTYDVDGNVREQREQDLTGGDAPRVEKHVFNDYGQEIESTTPAGATTTFDYDLLGRMVKQTSPDGTVTTAEYDPTGNLTGSYLENWTGDPNNPSNPRRLRVADNSYDKAGRLYQETDAKGYITTHKYTDNGLEAKVIREDGAGSTYVLEETTYDEAGNSIREVTNNGLTVEDHVYDAAGRETSSVDDPDGSLKRVSEVTLDSDDRVLSSVQKDASGTVVSKMEALYDRAGRTLAQVSYHSTAPSPVGRWKLADGAGLSAADSAGNSPATAPGGLTWASEHGGAADLDGANALTTAGPVLDTARSFTVSAWVKLTDKNSRQRAVSVSGAQQSPFDLAYDKDSDRWRFLVTSSDAADAAGVSASSTSVPALNTWTLLTGVYDAKAGTAKLYVGSANEGTATGKPFGDNGPLVIGAGKGNGNLGNYWTGGISDVQAYQQALTSAEIAGIAGGTVPAAGTGISRTSFTYDENDQITSVTDPLGNVSYTSYDEDGNAVKTTAPAAMAESAGSGSTMAHAVSWTGYNTFGEVTDDKDALGNWSSTFYDADGRPTLQRSPSYTPPGSSKPITPESLSTYTDSGQIETTTDPSGNVTKYDYDQLDRLSKVTTPTGAATTYEYDEAGQQLSMTSPTGATTKSTYDYLGQEITSTDVVRQDGAAYTTKYDYVQDTTKGWSVTATSPRGVKSKTTYNVLGDPVSVQDGANLVTSLAYDGAGRQTRTTLSDQTYSTTTYDLAGLPLKDSNFDEAGKLLRSSETEYDAAGNVTAAIDGRATRTTYDYDATGMLVREHQPISGSDAIETTFGYDLEGNRTRFTDGRGNAFWTTYNSWGMPESQIEPAAGSHQDPADRTFTTVYDRNALPVHLIQPGGVTIDSSYDAMGQLKTQTGSGAEAATVDRTFDYDDGGRLTEFSGVGGTNIVTYDDRDQPRSIKGPSGNSLFGYDADGGLASRNDAAGETTYSYDTAGRIAGLTNSGKGVSLTYGYDPKINRLQKITYGAGGNARTFGYDKLGRLTSDELANGAGTTTLAKIGYDWNANNDLITKTTTNFAGKTTANIYDYDLADRLVSWKDSTATTVYAYDKSGNRTQNGAKTFTYDERNRLQDGDGTNCAYTARGTLLSAGGDKTAADAFGQVITQTHSQGGATKTYRYDALGRVVQDGFAYTGSDNDLAGDGSATYVRGVGSEVVAEANNGGSTRLAWTDLHDDIVAQFTGTGTELDASVNYDPLGKVIGAAGAMMGGLGYQSEWSESSTSRVNMMARWYNTDTGQFDTRDTAGNSPVPDSVSANRYQYGDANPLTVTDPSGHWGLPKFIKKAVSAARSTLTAVSSYASYSYRAASSAVKKTVKKASTKLGRAYNRAKKAVHRAVHAAKKRVQKFASAVKRKVKKAVSAVKKKVVKFVKAAVHKAAQVTKAAVKFAKQAGKKVAAAAKRVVKNPVQAVKDAAKATKQFVVTHKDALLEIAAVGVGILAGMACTLITGGVGAVACMVGASALVNLTKDALQGDIHSIGDALGSVGTGALQGLAGGAGGMLAGKLGTLVAGKVGSGLLGRLATEAVENGSADIITQAVTTGRVNPKAAMLGMIPGLGAVSRKSGAARKIEGGLENASSRNVVSLNTRGPPTSCLRHSFAPDTRVLMADGTAWPIKDVNVGDKVLATDPSTGTSRAEMVTRLHRNTDHDMSKLTVKDEKHRTAVLNTTQNHPFWDATDRRWTNAKDLKPDHQLKVPGRGTIVVAHVDSYTSSREMRDLTVNDTHTYYVLAGDTPALVHNNDGDVFSLEHVDTVERHLATLDKFGANDEMISRIRSNMASGDPLSSSQTNFMRHETTEARLMGDGMSYEDAHTASLGTHPPGQNYDVDLIKKYPEFGPWWHKQNGLGGC